jgi:hypothetical protein
MAENSDTSSTEDKPTEYTSSTEDSEDTHEYPSLWKLALIIIGLALAVFCMALVRTRSTCSPSASQHD